MTDDDRERAADTPAEGAAGDPAPEPAPAPGDAPVPEDLPPPAPTAEAVAKPKKQRGNWIADLKAIFWLLLAVLVFHSCVAKPFYIPSESMMPGLLKGDRLVVTKYPYGWSWVSPSFHIFPQWEGRIWGRMPRRGDVVIATPPDSSADYIKRVIGLPGDTIQLIAGEVYLNGQKLRRERRPDTMIPLDENVPCGSDAPDQEYSRRFRFTAPDGRRYCRMPVYREYIPDGNELRAYDTIDSIENSPGDDYPLYVVPANSVFLMGDNRDDSADSRFDRSQQGLNGAVPWENIGGRAWTSLHPETVPQNQGQNQGTPQR